MAVSFKVPASPKRSIFNIDNFLGVDLTNTGANIEEVRSPNAENMVRYVPGKVRKRTGFRKEIVFGKDINVNYAEGTSATEKNIVVNTDKIDTWIKVYDLFKTIESKDGNDYDIYYEFDYLSDDDFYISGDDVLVTASGEDWEHFSYVRSLTFSDSMEDISIKSAVEQSIYIKNFSVMYGKDSDYKWSPAPKYFIERASNDPVYGVHVGKTNIVSANRIVNVNRALNTSDSFVAHPHYTLGEMVDAGRKIYIEFDYKPHDYGTYAVDLLIGDEVFATITPAVSGHFSGEYTVQNPYHKDIYFLFQYDHSEPNVDIDVKSFSLMYQIDETYSWKVAPEDNGQKFHIEDLYYVDSRNYSTVTSYQGEHEADSPVYGGGYSAGMVFIIGNADSNVKGLTHVSFELYTTGEAEAHLDRVVVYIQSLNGNQITLLEKTDYLNGKYDFYYYPSNDPDDYFERIHIRFHTRIQDEKFFAQFNNVQVNTTTPRTTYDISSFWYIYHVGRDFYLRQNDTGDFTKIYSNANAHLSKSWQFNKKVFILDGKDIYLYTVGESGVSPIGQETGYIPTVTIAKEPAGGGKSYEPLNMLQPGFIELFKGDGTTRNYNLSFNNLDNTPVRVWVLQDSGVWVQYRENTQFSVNRVSGIVTFSSSYIPAEPVVRGEDNVKIQAYRTVEGYRDRITKCTNGTLFGVGGAEDRLFLTGNPEYANWDFYSERYDPTYFPDTGYSSLGSEQSAIVGYSIINNYLAAFKDGFDQSQTVFIREGDLVTDDENVSQPAFKLINTLQGNGVIAPYAFSYLANEPVFLTKAGIYAITAQDITGEKYSQNRSFYLNGKLTEESGMEDAVATSFNDMYVLALNNQLYILDGLQATRTDRSEPYATRQYVGFHCTGVPAVCLWTDNDSLWFGTNDGKVCVFNKDIAALESYSDDGQPIYCCWETPDLDGKLFYKNKTFRYFAIRMMKALRTSVKLWSEKLGGWSFIKEDTSSGVVFDFENIDFDNFSFSTDTSEKVVHTKVRVKKVDKARFRVENGKLNEPFGLFDLALEYVESGNYKG